MRLQHRICTLRMISVPVVTLLAPHTHTHTRTHKHIHSRRQEAGANIYLAKCFALPLLALFHPAAGCAARIRHWPSGRWGALGELWGAALMCVKILFDYCTFMDQASSTQPAGRTMHDHCIAFAAIRSREREMHRKELKYLIGIFISCSRI